jgi:regulator of protease activity HflC (stomatin/prohibitin superfamily)
VKIFKELDMENVIQTILGVVVVVVFVAFLSNIVRNIGRRVTVFDYERGLKYVKGRFKSVLEPGQYWYMPLFSTIDKIDIRPRFVSISGQELLSADGITIKVSVAVNFEVIDPALAKNKVMDFEKTLYSEIQLAVREIIGQTEIDAILEGRNEISQRLMEMLETKSKDIGLNLILISIKDIMFPGKLKEMFAQVVSARKEGLAILEKARGETAALRNLANAAKMLEDNPNLLQLRLIQALSETSGNSLVYGMPTNEALSSILKNKK